MAFLSVALCALVIYYIVKRVYREYTSPIRYLPGPPSKSLIFGNLNEIFSAENSVMHEKWVEEYGPTIRYHGFLGQSRFYTTDVKATQHVLMNHYEYQKPGVMRTLLVDVFGDGLLNTEGDRHKFQNPAFGPAQIRQLTAVFVEKANELRDAWKGQIERAEGTARIEVLSWLSKMTLDVIGRAGFNYEFNAIASTDDNQNELNQAFTTIFSQSSNLGLWSTLRAHIPALRVFPNVRDGVIRTARGTMHRIGEQLLKDSKRTLAAQDEKTVAGRDLLTLLVKSNMNEKQAQQMTDEDVLAQVPTFLIAGHETTSTATTWALYALVQRPAILRKLREELLSVPTDTPTMDQLNELPYLDAVVRETLRVHPPVPSTTREATQDGVLPLSEPVNGKDYVHVRKGQAIFISILALNRSKKLWGEDAAEFNPDRWVNGRVDTSLPGVWGNMMTFLGGARSCIGFRFALVEMKALMFSLIRTFDFELAVPLENISKKSSIVQRPYVKSEEEKGGQLPLLIKVYNPDD
ncbi:hypothetical protein V5O48_006598 [Marasmius crinis-equi]|uniref:Cytochrome P450 n=1 Tax=Marasmius crinis-equi TaxID=585013 RepID=A0ABR3FJN2_9AGAR